MELLLWSTAPCAALCVTLVCLYKLLAFQELTKILQ